jgi:pyruvate dehydrogenase (quinone)
VIFGLPDAVFNGIMEALRKVAREIRFYPGATRESHSAMALRVREAHWSPGMCPATSGSSGIRLLNGLYDTKLDGRPVLAITGSSCHDLSTLTRNSDR